MKQNAIPKTVKTEDWLYSIPIQDECDASQSNVTTEAILNQYLIRTCQGPQRLIE